MQLKNENLRQIGLEHFLAPFRAACRLPKHQQSSWPKMAEILARRYPRPCGCLVAALRFSPRAALPRAPCVAHPPDLPRAPFPPDAGPSVGRVRAARAALGTRAARPREAFSARFAEIALGRRCARLPRCSAAAGRCPDAPYAVLMGSASQQTARTATGRPAACRTKTRIWRKRRIRREVIARLCERFWRLCAARVCSLGR